MNFSSVIGMGLGIAVLFLSLFETNPNVSFFLDYHSFLIVCGGTLAAASISFPLSDIMMLVKVFFIKLFWRPPNFQAVITDILELNKKAAVNPASLTEVLPSIKNEFLKEGVALVAGGVLSEHEIRDVMELRLQTIEQRYMSEANMFRTIGRFPPAFGLLATTLGMIGLLQKLGAPDSQKLIGPAMSLGLIGTLYGIALANLVFLPLAEHLTLITQKEITLRRLIVEGCVLMKAKTNPVLLREELNSFLLPRERVQRKAA